MELLLVRSATKQLLKIPHQTRTKIEKEIEKLTNNPFPPKSTKLTGREGYRLRIGDYRVLYFVDKKRRTITVLSAQHRKDAYKLK